MRHLSGVLAVVVLLQSGAVLAKKAPPPKRVTITNFPAVLRPTKASDLAIVDADTDVSAQCDAGGTKGIAFDRLLTPPTIVSFQIPSGKVFVITSFSWNLFQGTRPSQSRGLSLFRAVGGAVNGPSAQSRALADGTG